MNEPKPRKIQTIYRPPETTWEIKVEEFCDKNGEPCKQIVHTCLRCKSHFINIMIAARYCPICGAKIVNRRYIDEDGCKVDKEAFDPHQTVIGKRLDAGLYD